MELHKLGMLVVYQFYHFPKQANNPNNKPQSFKPFIAKSIRSDGNENSHHQNGKIQNFNHLNTFQPFSRMSDYELKAKELINSNKYLMLSKSWCPDCTYTYSVFEKFGVKDKIHIIELDKFENQQEADLLQDEFTKIAGRKWVPTIFFNGETFDESKLKKLTEDGKLEQFFKDHKLIN